MHGSIAIFHYTFHSPFRMGDHVRVSSILNGSGDGLVSGYGLTSERYVFHFVDVAGDDTLGGIESQEMVRLDGTATVGEVRMTSEYGLGQRVEFLAEGETSGGSSMWSAFMSGG